MSEDATWTGETIPTETASKIARQVIVTIEKEIQTRKDAPASELSILADALKKACEAYEAAIRAEQPRWINTAS